MIDNERAAWRLYLKTEKIELLQQIQRVDSMYSGAYDPAQWDLGYSRDDGLGPGRETYSTTVEVAIETMLGVIELINEQMSGFLVVPAKYLEGVADDLVRAARAQEQEDGDRE